MSAAKAAKRARHPPVKPAILADATELTTLLRDYSEKTKALRATVQELTTRIEEGCVRFHSKFLQIRPHSTISHRKHPSCIIRHRLPTCSELPTSKGISFLEVKSHLLLQYCVNLCCLLLVKVDGHSLVAHQVVAQLITLRIFIEKTRPIDQKLKYQVDKLLKTATIGNLAAPSRSAAAAATVADATAGKSANFEREADPLHFRPNPAALLARSSRSEGRGMDDGGADDDDDDDNDDSEFGARAARAQRSSSDGSGVYRPPMMEAVYYHEDERADKKDQARREKELRKVSSSSMMKQLREEFSDRPTESRGAFAVALALSFAMITVVDALAMASLLQISVSYFHYFPMCICFDACLFLQCLASTSPRRTSTTACAWSTKRTTWCVCPSPRRTR
jgi:hypothetical protein